MPSYHLKDIIDKELFEEFEAAILDQVRWAYEDSKLRDDMLVTYSNMVEGLTPIQSASRYEDSCELQYPLVKKAFFTLSGQMIQQFKREIKVTVTGVDPDDEEGAESQEQFLVAKDHECGVTPALTEVGDNAIKYPVGIAYVGWAEEYKYERRTVLQDRQTGQRLPVANKDDNADYDEAVERVPSLVYEGVRVRAVDTQDFYLYPADSVSEQTAYGCGERQIKTEVDLLLGIDNNDYDEDKVEELIHRGPCRLKPETNRTTTNDDLGIEETSRYEDQGYEVFEWYCKAPIIKRNGKIVTPKHLYGEELYAVVCPAANIVLYLDYTEECYQSSRPYVPFYLWGRPNYFYGYCLPQILETLQTESDAISRQYIDALNLATTPAFKEIDSTAEMNSNWELFPGARYRCRVSLNEVEPFEMPQPNPANLEVLQAFKAEAEELYSASNLNLQKKVRKAQEVQAAQQIAAGKFDSFYFHLSGSAREGTGVIELMKRIVMLYAYNASEDEIEYVDESAHAGKVNKDQLKKRYIYRAAGNGTSADPELKLEHAIAAKQISDEYTQIKMGIMQSAGGPTDDLVRAWKARRAILADMNIGRIEDYIGPMPELKPQQPAAQPGIAPLVQGGQNAANGNGGAGQQPSMVGAFAGK